MHEIAEPAAIAFAVLVLAAASLAEVRHGRQLSVERPTYQKLATRPK